MVTDRTAYIGTSNWSGDYFINTAGIGLVMNDDENDHEPVAATVTGGNDTSSSSSSSAEVNTQPRSTIRSDLAAIFDRDWNSMYALELIR